MSLTSSITERADIFVLSVVPPSEPTKKLAARGVVNDVDRESGTLPYVVVVVVVALLSFSCGLD
jgi:hypothetical protein